MPDFEKFPTDEKQRKPFLLDAFKKEITEKDLIALAKIVEEKNYTLPKEVWEKVMATITALKFDEKSALRKHILEDMFIGFTPATANKRQQWAAPIGFLKTIDPTVPAPVDGKVSPVKNCTVFSFMRNGPGS